MKLSIKLIFKVLFYSILYVEMVFIWNSLSEIHKCFFLHRKYVLSLLCLKTVLKMCASCFFGILKKSECIFSTEWCFVFVCNGFYLTFSDTLFCCLLLSAIRLSPVLFLTDQMVQCYLHFLNRNPNTRSTCFNDFYFEQEELLEL